MKEFQNATWPRVKTTRRYLHCPKSERMYTLFAEGKVIFGEITEGNNGEAYWDEVFCSGVWFTHGDNNEAFDFKECVNVVDKNGIPVHAIRHKFSGIDVIIEAFSDVARKSSCFIKVTLNNNTEKTVVDKFGFIVRTGLEGTLVDGAPDLYCTYAPNINTWKEYENSWKYENGEFRDNETYLTCDCTCPVSFDNGVVNYEIKLEPNSTKEITLIFGKGKTLSADYNTEKAKTTKFWEEELKRITNLPKKILSDEVMTCMIKSLTIQILQNFCYYITRDSLVLRQGGLQRRIWQWEAMFALKALGMIGEFSDYIEPVIDFYFNESQTDEGEVLCFGEPWANITASSLQTLMDYCNVAGKDFYEKYRDSAIAAFNWIKATRAKSATIEGHAPGLFPSLRGNDSRAVFQNWCATDVQNLDSLRVFYETAERFGDDFSVAIKEEYTDYLTTARKYFNEYSKSLGDVPTARIPLTPFGNPEDLVKSYFFEGLGFRLHDIIVDNEYELERSIKFYSDIDRVAPDRDMYGIRLRNKDGSEPHIWYTANTEYYLFRFYMRHGMPQKALSQINCLLKYSITDDFYMFERYCDHDEYYSPWCPNVSANGRLIQMLCEFYK